MRPLPLVPSGCSLTLDAVAAQANRAAELRGAIVELERTPRRLRVRFAADVDATAVARFAAVERGCCPFLAIAWDAPERELTVAAPDGTGADAVGAIASFLAEAA